MRPFRWILTVALSGGFLFFGGWKAHKRVMHAAAVSKSFADYDPEVDKLMSKMTLDDKIGQMTQVDQQFLKSIDDIDNYHLGSLLNGGDSDPKTGNDLQSWTKMYERYQARALKTRLAIPLLYGVDAVHGHNNVIGAVIFPQNIGLGCTRDAALVEKAARITALEVRATGINWAFAPCVTVPQDIRWGRTYEGYSEDPSVVKELGAAAVRGLQWNGLGNPEAVLACSKHFAGDGGTTFGTGLMKPGGKERYPLDHGDTRLNEADFRRIHLQGYLSTIPEGVGSIMPSYSSWNGVKCSADKHLLTDILKDQMGFQGFVISDYAAINEIPNENYKQQIRTSIDAGMDMVMVPEHYQEFVNDLKELANDGSVPMSRIDDAVRRILRVKFAMGMMGANHSQMPNPGLQKSFGSPEHRQVARQAVRESLVLLKNNNRVLPLAKSAARIHVAGKSANNIGNQCGGWTIYWQGRTGDVTTGGTTILKAIQQAVSKNTKVTFSEDGTGAAGATVGVVVVGETPYAEMFGDRRDDLHLAPKDVAAIHNLKQANIPVVLVLISGRPLFLDNVLNDVDAIIAAWLPGTEGEGVADVLFGDYKPTGKLSFTWPKASSTSLHRGDTGYQTLYAFGYGLKY
ncbi:MAG TPA: glycoside hydrolase family 3 N-terminal domain-containing protein [Bryobacteraceae bacterium]|nr:glycoside hydrolase family 3 N-terminal domain-containing protein [Bryobacteraceae bacterium]